jgi:Fic family protein
MKTQIVPTQYFDAYHEKQRIAIGKHITHLKEKPPDNDKTIKALIESAFFSSRIDGNPILLDNYLTYHFTGTLPLNKPIISGMELVFIEAAVASCNIEGNPTTVEEYLQFLCDRLNSITKADEIKEIFTGYEYAQNNALTLSAFYKAHEILSHSLIYNPAFRGSNRDHEAGVYNEDGLIYKATSAAEIEAEMKKLFSDISLLLKSDLSLSEAFYYSSFLHQILIKIHPFILGNGIAARLLEKWFLAQKIGSVAWQIPSEKLYQNRRKSYYRNIMLGKDYQKIDYGLTLPFLLMLPRALTAKF